MELGFRGQNVTVGPLINNGASGDVKQPHVGFPHLSDINLCYRLLEQSGWE